MPNQRKSTKDISLQIYIQAFNNLTNNHMTAIAVIDCDAQKSFRIESTAHIHEGDDLANYIMGKID